MSWRSMPPEDSLRSLASSLLLLSPPPPRLPWLVPPTTLCSRLRSRVRFRPPQLLQQLAVLLLRSPTPLLPVPFLVMMQKCFLMQQLPTTKSSSLSRFPQFLHPSPALAEGETEDWIGFPRLRLCRFPSLLLLLSPYFFGTHLSNLVIAASAAAERK